MIRYRYFFSATYPDEVREFANHIVHRPVSIVVKKEELTVSAVSQLFVRCEHDAEKLDKLQALYSAVNVGQSVIFVNQRRKAFHLANQMKAMGFSVSLICGTQENGPGEERMDPALRDSVMEQFRKGETKVLVATDVLARGIDVPQVTLVVNYEVPVIWATRGADMETYLHRVGRTGRFGLKGIAVNLVTAAERSKLDDICSFFECKIHEMDEDFDSLADQLRQLR